MIYKLAIGSQLILISSRPKNIQEYSCENDTGPTEKQISPYQRGTSCEEYRYSSLSYPTASTLPSRQSIHIPPLWLTCRQLYQETSHLLYTLNSFTFLDFSSQES